MKRKIATMFLIAACAMFGGCTSTFSSPAVATTTTETNNKEKIAAFTELLGEVAKDQKEKDEAFPFELLDAKDGIKIYLDKQTQVEYVVFTSGEKIAITPRYNLDGTFYQREIREEK